MSVDSAKGEHRMGREHSSCCIIRGSRRDIVFITVYLVVGEGISGGTLHGMGQIHDMIKAFNMPWVLVGYVDMEP